MPDEEAAHLHDRFFINVFSHGRGKWKRHQVVPHCAEPRDRAIEAMRDSYDYLLFDTRRWSLEDKGNASISDNAFTLSAIHLMKNAFTPDKKTITSMFEYWRRRRQSPDRHQRKVLYRYLLGTFDITLEEFIAIEQAYKDSEGDRIMPSLAPRLREEGLKQGMEKGKREKALESATRLLADGLKIDYVAEVTGLSVSELKGLSQS